MLMAWIYSGNSEVNLVLDETQEYEFLAAVHGILICIVFAAFEIVLTYASQVFYYWATSPALSQILINRT